ncbi:MAG: DUF6464 family protein [Cyanobium sp.]|jgi:hypothetical protein
MRVELRDPLSKASLARLELEDPNALPQPGRWFVVEGRSYLVLQRSHRYSLRNGRYQLCAVALDVKVQERPADARPFRHGFVIGDPGCRFNALSPLLRCAVLPEGPCERCSAYRPRDGGPVEGDGR